MRRDDARGRLGRRGPARSSGRRTRGGPADASRPPPAGPVQARGFGIGAGDIGRGGHPPASPRDSGTAPAIEEAGKSAAPPSRPRSAMSPRALVTFPAPIRGLASWTLETIEPRARVYSLSFLPSRRRLAAGDGLGTIRIYENDTGRLECVLVGHEGAVLSLAWSPDGRTLASGDSAGVIRLWRVEGRTGRTLHVIRAPDDRAGGVMPAPSGVPPPGPAPDVRPGPTPCARQGPTPGPDARCAGPGPARPGGSGRLHALLVPRRPDARIRRQTSRPQALGCRLGETHHATRRSSRWSHTCVEQGNWADRVGRAFLAPGLGSGRSPARMGLERQPGDPGRPIGRAFDVQASHALHLLDRLVTGR